MVNLSLLWEEEASQSGNLVGPEAVCVLGDMGGRSVEEKADTKCQWRPNETWRVTVKDECGFDRLEERTVTWRWETMKYVH